MLHVAVSPTCDADLEELCVSVCGFVLACLCGSVKEETAVSPHKFCFFMSFKSTSFFTFVMKNWNKASSYFKLNSNVHSSHLFPL